MIIETEQPSNSIMKFFENKLKYHIYLVCKYMYKLIENDYTTKEEKQELIRLCKIHDMDRFDLPQFIPQSLYYEYKEKNLHIDKKLKKLITNSIKLHKTKNQHHPEYYDDLNNMTKTNIIEFVCDIKAIYNKEKDLYGIITTKYPKFNNINLKIIKDVLKVLK